MAGIVLEMFRLKETLETVSEFYIIEDPFCDDEPSPVSKEDARRYIRDNMLFVAEEDNTGRIYDTAAHLFQRKWGVSERFRKTGEESKEESIAMSEARANYRERLFSLIDRVWGDGNDCEEE